MTYEVTLMVRWTQETQPDPEYPLDKRAAEAIGDGASVLESERANARLVEASLEITDAGGWTKEQTVNIIPPAEPSPQVRS